MKLKQLFPDYCDELKSYAELEIADLSLDSRKVSPGDLFFAYPGMAADGRDYIDQAIQAGAVAVLAELEPGSVAPWSVSLQQGVPVFAVPQVQAMMGPAASVFYAHPSQQLQTIAVTGTNGKTSAVHFIQHMAQSLGQPAASMGTLGISLAHETVYTGLTTPHAIDLQRYTSTLCGQGVQLLALEASAHGLSQHRLAGFALDVGIWTNLRRDHLNDFSSMEAYAEAKKILFTRGQPQLAVINADDARGAALIAELRAQGLQVLALSEQLGSGADLIAENVSMSQAGLRFKLTTPWGAGFVQCPLWGQYHVMNLMGAIAALGGLGYALDKLIHAIASMPAVPGRLEQFQAPNHPLTLVDYAHTDDALQYVLEDIRQLFPQAKIFSVLGCGGSRDQGKRPRMGQVAEQFADHVVLTNDNPRFEDPHSIAEDMLSGMRQPEAAHIELDRAKAIQWAIQQASSQDVVLVTGKGRENFNWVQGKRLEHCDITVVQQALGLL